MILAAHNTSATSLLLRWRPLAADQLRGEFQAYRITYRERNGSADTLQEVRLRDEKTQVSETLICGREHCMGHSWESTVRARRTVGGKHETAYGMRKTCLFLLGAHLFYLDHLQSYGM